MKYTLATLALGGLASAAGIPRDTCSCKFTITASGGQSGVVGQLSDGQNRIGGGNPTGEYCINNGQITDSQGRGCILTPPTTQFQCDTGATPTSGFSLGSNGQVEYNGSQTFYACPASDTMYNIYTTPVSGQTKCVEVQLTASGCYAQSSSAQSMPATTMKTSMQMTQPHTTTVVKTVQSSCPAPQTATVTQVKTAEASCPAPQTSTVTQTVVKTAQATCPAPSTVTVTQPAATQPASSKPASSKPASSQPASQPASSMASSTAPATTPSSTGKTCPTNLSGAYQYPHLIIPVSKSQPNKACGTSYDGTITSDISSIFNFDIPASYTGTCSLVFLFPTQAELQTSSYTFSGNGEFDFAQLNTVATQSTDYANMGSVKTDFGTKTATPGSSVVVSTFACPAGQAVSYEISSVSGSSLTYFQDYNPSPIGLYITSC
ncbi:uncharacterized protein LY89DRAFT_690265 [Mollisia scopiformis]|uniref:Uncharacterized protein n=1 Tax=Mollisia scopiformis TaxID=149040 RepID=A0A132B9X5_MOLSC|nr:uncharacterized protein LY89DRAFT_690265 [Mollisia scopiformis]KUJ09205.1 hypothetical protein LY89DRAFT_690265 [Mollisia scopiformis]